jgi:hypothetical protein
LRTENRKVKMEEEREFDAESAEDTEGTEKKAASDDPPAGAVTE